MPNSAKKNDKFIPTFFQIQVSDGEHFLSATMAPTLRKATRNGEIVKNTLIKVLDFEKQAINGHTTLRLNKVSIVSQDPGQRFGNPSFYYDVFHDKDEDDGQPIVSSDTPIETQICQELMQRQDRGHIRETSWRNQARLQRLRPAHLARYPAIDRAQSPR